MSEKADTHVSGRSMLLFGGSLGVLLEQFCHTALLRRPQGPIGLAR